jgi:hypothetical protein
MIFTVFNLTILVSFRFLTTKKNALSVIKPQKYVLEDRLPLTFPDKKNI